MSVNAHIKTALDGLGLPVKPDQYKGDAESYIVFNYTSMAALYGDDCPAYVRFLVQVHLFCPIGQNGLRTRESIKRRLFRAGFTWPEEVNAGDGSMQKNDENKQHYVFECEFVEGVDLSGEPEC